MLKKILNYLFGSKNTTKCDIHGKMTKTLKESEASVNLTSEMEVVKSTKKRTPRKPKTDITIGTDAPLKVKEITKVKAPKSSTQENTTSISKKSRKPKTDK